MSEVLTMAQHLELTINNRIECNKTFMRCTAEAKGGLNEALMWMRHNVSQSTCRQILDDVNSSSTCKERLLQWGKTKASSRCGAQSSCGPSWSRMFTRIHLSAAFYLDFFKDSTVT